MHLPLGLWEIQREIKAERNLSFQEVKHFIKSSHFGIPYQEIGRSIETAQREGAGGGVTAMEPP